MLWDNTVDLNYAQVSFFSGDTQFYTEKSKKESELTEVLWVHHILSLYA